MNIKLWTDFTKRKNSTLQPAGGQDVSCYLKEDTSILRPSFIISRPVTQYTYAQAFGNYYFVEDVVNLDANRSEVVCRLDPLATYKGAITGYTAFVERAASSYDPYVNDPLLSMQQVPLNIDKVDTSLSTFFGSGCFITEVLAMNKGVAVYVTPNLLPYQHILNPGVYSNNDVNDWVVSRISQSFDLDVYIGSIKWVPFSITQLGNTMNDFWIGPINMANLSGWSSYGYTTKELNQSATKGDTFNLVLPSTGYFNEFRDSNPRFTQYNLYLPGVGIVSLDPAIIGYAVKNAKTIGVDIMVDLISCEITYVLGFVSGAAYFARYSGNIGVDVPIGKSAVDVAKSAKMFAGSTAAGAAAGGVIGAAAGAFVGAVEAVYNEMKPNTSIMVGGSGNKLELITNRTMMRLTREQYGAREYPTNVAGRPLYSNVMLGSLTGYVKCGNASVPVNAPDSVRDEINRYLNSGFYIE